MDELDKKIIRITQEEFPLVAQPYKEIAARVGIAEEELLKRLRSYKRAGKIRKVGAVLRHREVGFAANSLCVWVVPEERLEEVGALMAMNPSVSHCYDRETVPEWQYNMYTMIHAHTREECVAIAKRIAKQTKIDDYLMLYSVKEWKKTSMRYFCE